MPACSQEGPEAGGHTGCVSVGDQLSSRRLGASATAGRRGQPAALRQATVPRKPYGTDGDKRVGSLSRVPGHATSRAVPRARAGHACDTLSGSFPREARRARPHALCGQQFAYLQQSVRRPPARRPARRSAGPRPRALENHRPQNAARQRDRRAGPRRRGACRELQSGEARAGERAGSGVSAPHDSLISADGPPLPGPPGDGPQFSRGRRVPVAASQLGLVGLRRAVVPDRAALPPPVPVRGAWFRAETVPPQRARALRSGPHPAAPADPEPAGGNPGCEPCPPRRRARGTCDPRPAPGPGRRGSRSASPAKGSSAGSAAVAGSVRGLRRPRARPAARAAGHRVWPSPAGRALAEGRPEAWTRVSPERPPRGVLARPRFSEGRVGGRRPSRSQERRPRPRRPPSESGEGRDDEAGPKARGPRGQSRGPRGQSRSRGPRGQSRSRGPRGQSRSRAPRCRPPSRAGLPSLPSVVA
ncbi:collagen alpha-1(II) chain-like [Mustela lutreola]|uniref:collagen alpha-1(II) chain-like n=1 Tax=Mustela lutreola TaxID=9666 RepID=UPI0027971FE6|nr:collagen alpha-1(II) chain-like [Mustela lutreola]